MKRIPGPDSGPGRQRPRERRSYCAPLRRGTKSPFSDPEFVLALAGFRRLIVQIKAFEKDSLLRDMWAANAQESVEAVERRCAEVPTRLFRTLELYWRSPDSGDLRYTSRHSGPSFLKRARYSGSVEQASTRQNRPGGWFTVLLRSNTFMRNEES